MNTDLMTWLPDDLLVKLDRMAMANSLEGRTPYLSHHIVDFSYGLQQEDWIKSDEYKVLLREVAKEYLPDSIFTRPKQGFVLPMDEWIIRWFKKESVRAFFESRRIEELNTEKIISWVENELKKDSFNQRLIFALIMLHEWYKINIKENNK
jgi:asparagine synthase (glutamine-hydrolysing)